MYRCVTLVCMNRGIDLSDSEAVAQVARHCKIEFADGRILANESDVTEAIRETAISIAIKEVADNLQVRNCMVEAQRRWAVGKNAVTEGRDQGTVAFPTAECKIFLTASAEVRADRRVKQLHAMNKTADYDSILAAQKERDLHDRTRPVGALVAAPDASTVDTDGLSEEQVLQRLVEIVRERIKKSEASSFLDPNAPVDRAASFDVEART